MTFLDTHILVWLYAGVQGPFSERAKRELQSDDIVVSPVVLLELQYLYEAKKINKNGEAIFSALQKTMGVRMMEYDWGEVMRAALALAWTRDPFDRIIVAHALLYEAALLTKDRQIRRHYAGAIW